MDNAAAIKQQLFDYLIDCGEFEEHEREELDSRLFKNRSTVRLSRSGYQCLKKHFQHSSFGISSPLTGKELLTLKYEVQYPYFLTATRLYLFSSKDVFIIKLNGGDVKKWLASKSKNA